MAHLLTVRPAESVDSHTIWRIHTEAIRGIRDSHTPDEIESWARKHTPDGYAESIAAKRIFVAEVNREVIGFGQFNCVTAVVERVYVLPSASRNGVGKALMREAERRAIAAGWQKLYLSSSLNAVTFYERCGFVRGGRNSQATPSREEGVPMVKALIPNHPDSPARTWRATSTRS